MHTQIHTYFYTEMCAYNLTCNETDSNKNKRNIYTEFVLSILILIMAYQYEN
jgi:hypothetical protein